MGQDNRRITAPRRATLHAIVVFESQILPSGRRKLHLGSLARAFGRLKISVILLEAGPTREQAVRKLADVSVIRLDRIVVALPLDGNPILSARQLDRKSTRLNSSH